MKEEKKKFNKQEYDNKWKRENQDRITFMVYKGKKDIIKRAAADHGLPMGKFIEYAVDQQLDHNREDHNKVDQHSEDQHSGQAKPGITYKK